MLNTDTPEPHILQSKETNLVFELLVLFVSLLESLVDTFIECLLATRPGGKHGPNDRQKRSATEKGVKAGKVTHDSPRSLLRADASCLPPGSHGASADVVEAGQKKILGLRAPCWNLVHVDPGRWNHQRPQEVVTETDR